MSTTVKNLTPFKTEGDPTHFKGIPHPREIVRGGGLPGVEYCYVLGKNIGKFQKVSRNEDRSKVWSLTRNIPVISIEGPKGLADSVVVMSRGTPIGGASVENGIRRWGVDLELLSLTGLKPQTFEEVGNAASEPRQEAGKGQGKAQGREGDARIQGGNAP